MKVLDWNYVHRDGSILRKMRLNEELFPIVIIVITLALQTRDDRSKWAQFQMLLGVCLGLFILIVIIVTCLL